MQLAAGTRFGTFEVVSLIGVGGMGEVYRSRDSRLNRDVALKVLPEIFAADPDRLARFRREAQMLAALNHPNIAAIHGLEDSGGRQALVLELVEGPTLADRIAQGPLPLEEALAIARQIVDALEAAHEQGIVHRDLKPANIKLRSDGTVKVLDFGLAKALSRGDGGSSVSSRPDITASPTLTSPAAMTNAGVILGTAAYMAPEQARGKTVDRRADIWAFGCVLFEMLTGRRAFQGDDVTDTLASILRGEPTWDALSSSTPPAVRRLLRRCLEKNSRERLQAVGDARLEIADALRSPADESTSEASARSISRSRYVLPIIAASVVTGIVVGIGTWALKPESPAPARRVIRASIAVDPFDQRTPSDGTPLPGVYRPEWTSVALSPDSRTLVLWGIVRLPALGQQPLYQLFLRSLDSLDVKPIPGTEGALDPFLSTDGAWIGFWSTGELRRIPASGETATSTTIARVPAVAPQRVIGATWGDGDVIVFATSEGLWRVAASGGIPELVSKNGANEYSRRLPHLLPGSAAVLFTLQTTPMRWDDARILVKNLATGEEKPLLEDAADARYVATGHLVFMRRGTLMAAPFDLQRLQVTGGAVALVGEVMQAANLGNRVRDSGAGQFAVSAEGTLVYVTGGGAPDVLRELVWVDRNGAITPLPDVPAREYLGPRISPDGQRVVVSTQGSGLGGERVWTYDIPRRLLIPLTSQEDRAVGAVWSPDGSRIAFQLRSAAGRLAWRQSGGGGTSEFLTTEPQRFAPGLGSWSKDGKIAFVDTSPTTASDIWVVDVAANDRRIQAVVQTPANEAQPAFSPDGKWLAYTSNESGRNEVYVQAFPGPGPRIPAGAGTAAAWRGDGAELFFMSPVENTRGIQMMAASVTATATGLAVGSPRKLFEGRYVTYTPARGYDVTPDGQRFLMVRQLAPPPPPPTNMILVENWFEELKRRVPTATQK